MANVVLKLVINDEFSYKYMDKDDVNSLMNFLINNDILMDFGKGFNSKEILDGMEVISNPEKVNAFKIFHGEELHSKDDLIQLVTDKNILFLDDEENLQVVFEHTSDHHFQSEMLSYYFSDSDGIEIPESKKYDDESGIYITVDKNSKIVIKQITLEEYEQLCVDDDIELFLTWKKLWERYIEHGLYKILYD